MGATAPLSTVDATGLCAYLGWTSVAAGGAETNSSIAGGRETDPAQKKRVKSKAPECQRQTLLNFVFKCYVHTFLVRI